MYRSYVMICGGPNCTLLAGRQEKLAEEFEVQLKLAGLRKDCLLYTSDAADD